MSGQRSGNGVALAGAGTYAGSSLPISPNVGGWTHAGNYGLPTDASLPLGFNGKIKFGGIDYPFNGGYAIGRGALINGIKGLAGGGAIGLALAGLPYIIDWLTRSGGRINPTTGALERSNAGSQLYCFVEPCSWWQYNRPVNPNIGQAVGPFRTGQAACEDAWPSVIEWMGGGRVTGLPSHSNGQCRGTLDGVPDRNIFAITNLGSRPADSPTWYPSSMDDIAPYMQNVAPDGRVFGEILEKGGSVELPLPSITGPSSIQGPETVKQNQDGTKEISRTTYNFTTNNNTITNTSNVTTTTNYNSSNQVTGTTTSTTTPTSSSTTASEEVPTQCDKYPQSLGCAELDTPSEEVPKEQKTVTFAAEDRFGTGSCPADKSWSIETTGNTVKAVDWAMVCDFSLPLRGIVMSLAALAAILIVMPGGRQQL